MISIILLLLVIVISIEMIKKKRETSIFVFVSYIIGMVLLAFFFRERQNVSIIRLQPFHSWILLFRAIIGYQRWHLSLWEGIVLNIMLFIPCGFLLPVLQKKINYWWKMLIVGLLISFGIEIMQCITKLGIFDIDDVIDNSVGSLFGYYIYYTVFKKYE